MSSTKEETSKSSDHVRIFEADKIRNCASIPGCSERHNESAQGKKRGEKDLIFTEEDLANAVPDGAGENVGESRKSLGRRLSVEGDDVNLDGAFDGEKGESPPPEVTVVEHERSSNAGGAVNRKYAGKSQKG